MKLAAALISFVIPVASFASSFDKHFGNYDVLTPQSVPGVDRSSAGADDCAVTTAKLSRETIGDLVGVMLDLRSSKPNGCETIYKLGLSVSGRLGMTCEEGENRIECVEASSRMTTTIKTRADGTTELSSVSTGSRASTMKWILRRRP